jgi:predicted nucleic acid-binding Zn ribbon protein
VEEKEIKLNGETIAFSFDYISHFSKDEILSAISKLITLNPHVKSDGYVFNKPIEEFNDVYDFCSKKCIDFLNKNQLKYDRFILHKWVSILRSNPVQPMELDVENKEPTYHNHKEIAQKSGKTIPLYSFVYYVQMPDNLSGIDGHILFKKNGEVLKYLPKENEVLIFNSDLSHAPIHAKNSTKNRYVLAGDFILQNNVKENKTLI